jgi:hypothetical protein
MKFSREAERLIGDFRGIKGAPSFFGRGLPARALEDCLQRVFKAYPIHGSSFEQTLMDHWPNLLPAHLQKEVRLGKLYANGTLMLKVPSGPLRMEIRFLAPQILQSIHALEGGDQVKKIIWH